MFKENMVGMTFRFCTLMRLARLFFFILTSSPTATNATEEEKEEGDDDDPLGTKRQQAAALLKRGSCWQSRGRSSRSRIPTSRAKAAESGRVLRSENAPARLLVRVSAAAAITSTSSCW